MSSTGPLFVAGPDRSGTTLMLAILASIPGMAMTRRTNMWRYFYRRYGDLGVERNLDRCLDDMMRYRKMRNVAPVRSEIRSEFLAGPPTYGHLFSVIHEQNARRLGKQRWGDKSLHAEHFAPWIFEEITDARVIHMVRDPRDRYASVKRRYGRDQSRVGAATGRWLWSINAGLSNAERYPDRYMFVRYEDLVTRPEETVRDVCDFVGESFSSDLLHPGALPKGIAGNSSFGDVEGQAISKKPVGRFVEVLSPEDIAFIQAVAGAKMRHFGYQVHDLPRFPMTRYALVDLPSATLRMSAWWLVTRFKLWRGPEIPAEKQVEPLSR